MMNELCATDFSIKRNLVFFSPLFTLASRPMRSPHFAAAASLPVVTLRSLALLPRIFSHQFLSFNLAQVDFVSPSPSPSLSISLITVMLKQSIITLETSSI